MNREHGKSRLIVRRGQGFFLNLILSRNYDADVDGISIVFTLEGVERPLYGHGTLVASPVLHPNEVSEAAWQTVVDSFGENTLRLKVWSRKVLDNAKLLTKNAPSAENDKFHSFSFLLVFHEDYAGSRRDYRKMEDGYRHEEKGFRGSGELHRRTSILPYI